MAFLCAILNLSFISLSEQFFITALGHLIRIAILEMLANRSYTDDVPAIGKSRLQATPKSVF